MSLRRPTVASFPYIYLFTFRGVASDTRSVVIYVLLGFQADYRRFPFYLPCYANFWNVHWWIIHDASMHAFVISYVRTVLRVLSKYSLACWFGQMLTKAISWMKSLIASPTPRGVPVSLVRPWIWSLFYIRFRYQINSSSLTSTLDEMIDLESCVSLPAMFFHHRPILESVVCLHTTVSCPPLCIIIGVLVIIWLSNRSLTL